MQGQWQVYVHQINSWVNYSEEYAKQVKRYYGALIRCVYSG